MNRTRRTLVKKKPKKPEPNHLSSSTRAGCSVVRSMLHCFSRKGEQGGAYMPHPMAYEYKVINVADGALSSALLGEGRIETDVLEAYINVMAAEGWRLKFMEKVLQRHVVVADRETLMITFERPVPEEARETRAARCIDDVIAAEDGARRVGHRAAAGAVGLAAGGALLGAILSGSDEA